MSKTLLVPIDGTDASMRALPVAEQLGHGFDAPVVVVTVELPGSPRPPDPDRLGALEACHHGRTEVVASIEVADALDALVADNDDPVVCMATHARALPGRAWCGSIAESVLQHVEVPVVLVGPRFDRRWKGDGRIVVALDGSDHALDALATAVAWDATLALGITLVHVAHPLDVAVAPDAVVDEARTRFPRVDLEAEVIRSREPEWEIVDLARRLDASFVVCSTRLRTGLSRALMGSVAMGVVRRAGCPVLVRPFHGAAARAGGGSVVDAHAEHVREIG